VLVGDRLRHDGRHEGGRGDPGPRRENRRTGRFIRGGRGRALGRLPGQYPSAVLANRIQSRRKRAGHGPSREPTRCGAGAVRSDAPGPGFVWTGGGAEAIFAIEVCPEISLLEGQSPRLSAWYSSLPDRGRPSWADNETVPLTSYPGRNVHALAMSRRLAPR